jgi:hypothetical protein
MNIQPGVGYGFDSSKKGVTLNIGDPFPDPPAPYDCHALKVKYLGYHVSGSYHDFSVCVGTVNNLVPQLLEDAVWVKLDRLVSGEPSPPIGVFQFTSGETWVYLRVGKDSGSGEFPCTDDTQDGYPRIQSYNAVQTDDDDYGYILLAHGSANGSNIMTLYQDVSGSVWVSRLKMGTDTARYYWAGV